jgi:SAM-dependent methyltransferase
MARRWPGPVQRMINLAFLAGVNVYQIASLRRVPRFAGEARRYARLARRTAFPLRVGELQPILVDYAAGAGVASGHYFHQDLWAARRIYERRPKRHVDIGSRIDGFVAHLLTFMPVTAVDIRPLSSGVSGLEFVRGDACDLATIPSDSLESVSSLHAVEHIGLGRYGDPLDPDGCFAAMRELARVLAPGGRLYFGVPVGRERVQFNAHRIFNPETILHAFRGLRLVDLQAVDDSGTLIETPDRQVLATAVYSCGLFEFTKD